MPAYLYRSYYCSICHKGYQNNEEHKCNIICSSCHKINKTDNKDWIYCKDCNCSFQGDVCFQLLEQKTNQERSICASYFRCTGYGQSINRKIHMTRNINVEKSTARHARIVLSLFDDAHTGWPKAFRNCWWWHQIETDYTRRTPNSGLYLLRFWMHTGWSSLMWTRIWTMKNPWDSNTMIHYLTKSEMHAQHKNHCKTCDMWSLFPQRRTFV